MITLGIETSGSVGSLALRREGRCVEEMFLPELSRRHARMLVPELMGFLRRHGVRPRELGLVAVSVGPGAFTGLRVGVSCAKTLAYSTATPLVAVDTFLAIAENTPGAGRVAVIADAQRRGVLLGIFTRTRAGGWERAAAPAVVRREDLKTHLAGVELVSGPGLIGLDRGLVAGLEIARREYWLSRAAVAARLGEERFSRGEAEDPLVLEPHYARRSAAEDQRAGL